MSRCGGIFCDSFKKLSWNRLPCAVPPLPKYWSPEFSPSFWGNVSLTFGGTSQRLSHQARERAKLGNFTCFSLQTTLSRVGKGAKQGWNRWWENVASYSQLLQLTTCCPQRESSYPWDNPWDLLKTWYLPWREFSTLMGG